MDNMCRQAHQDPAVKKTCKGGLSPETPVNPFFYLIFFAIE